MAEDGQCAEYELVGDLGLAVRGQGRDFAFAAGQDGDGIGQREEAACARGGLERVTRARTAADESGWRFWETPAR
jgi:hypothetical protein